jgi:DNA-binding response OmpR family regulator
MSRILVADDDATMLGLLKTLFELEGHQVVAVRRPEDIIPAARRETPALILVDYHLAGGDVLDTLVELRRSEDLKQIPIVVTSGMDREAACLRAGADSFILKPFRPAQLLATLHEVGGL